MTKTLTKPKARALIYRNKSGGISVKLLFLDKPLRGFTFKYRVGTKRSIKINTDADRDKYQMVVGFSVLESFLSINGIGSSEVEVDPTSIDTFYGFKDNYVVKPTKGFIDKWWGCDCPDLYRYMVNKDGHTNFFGLRLACFSNKLVEASYMGAYIDPTITEEEVNLFAGDKQHTNIYKEMMGVVDARKLTDEKHKEMTDWIEAYEENIQKVIDDNKLVIMLHINDMFDEDGCEIPFGLDCGFLNVFTENEEYNKLKVVIKNSKRGASPRWLTGLKLPYETQSLTIKKKEFEKIKEVVYAATGEVLYCKTMLD